jgi:hypothetical protein
MCLTYGHGKISCTVINASMRCFQNAPAYFHAAVSYSSKMFMKWTTYSGKMFDIISRMFRKAFLKLIPITLSASLFPLGLHYKWPWPRQRQPKPLYFVVAHSRGLYHKTFNAVINSVVQKLVPLLLSVTFYRL